MTLPNNIKIDIDNGNLNKLAEDINAGYLPEPTDHEQNKDQYIDKGGVNQCTAAELRAAVVGGTSGYSGYSGISGYSGFSGISGFSGVGGDSGYSGDSGISGYSGNSGISGYSGESGMSGYSGDSGISGYLGDSGVSGFSGIDGVSGYSGYSGDSGVSGYSGVSGVSGYSGQLVTTILNTFYVDKKRVDSYTEDGSIFKPFKTIQSAINQVITNADNSQTNPYIIKVATGVYAENLLLEDTHLVSLIILGEGSRLQTQISPSSGYALQSMANNANFYDLHMENIQFTKPTMMVGSANNNYFGYNFFFVNCYWSDTALATFKNMTYPSFSGDICKFSGGVTFSNITQASINGIGGFKTTSGFTIETDQTANKPYLMTTGTAVLAVQCRTPNVTWSLLNITTMVGTALQIRAVRHGISGETIPLNAQILAYHSTLVGNYVNNGTLTLYNSQVSGTLSGTAPVLYQFAGQVKNDSTVTGVTVKDALNNLLSSGTSGYSGYSGASGYSGVSGSSGYSGITTGYSGTFLTQDGKTASVVNGLIINIV